MEKKNKQAFKNVAEKRIEEFNFSKRNLLIIAFLEGLSLIFIEILSAKILNSYFGASLKVWSIILSFTLFFLAIGYYYGGKISSKNNGKHLIMVLNLAAFVVIFTLIISNSIFSFVFQMELFTALIFAGFLLLGPQLFLFGCISPLIIQALDKTENNIAKTSGKVYFFSTIGGILGALILGFLMLETFGISLNYILISVLLLSSTILIIEVKKKSFYIMFFSLIFLCLISYNRINSKSDSSPVIYNSEGVLGQLKVLDMPIAGSNFSSRSLSINGINQTKIMNVPQAMTFWNYPHLINFFSHAKPFNSKALVLGLGGGSVVKEIQNNFKDIDVVELDSRIIDLAQKFFYLDPKNMRIFNDDARNFIRNIDKKYDLIIYDLLTGETQPNYVFTKESLQELKRILNANSLILVNYQGVVSGNGDLAFRTLFKTFKSAGFNVQFKSQFKNKFGDIVFVLTRNSSEAFDKIKLQSLNECCQKAKNMQRIEQDYFTKFQPNFEGVEILSDDKPKLELLNSYAIYKWRQEMRQSSSNEIIKSGNSIFN